MATTLLLGSSSASRKKLLTDARIPFTPIVQNADETLCDWNLPLQELVEGIALYKMEHAQVPAGVEGDICYVLTADTLGLDAHGTIQGKPSSREDAIEKLKASRGGMQTGTAFCLDKKVYRNGSWQVADRHLEFVNAHYTFDVPDEWLERYLRDSTGLKASGAIAIEEYGSLFLKSINGSYTTIVGLPMYELRLALEKFGFFT